MGPYHSAQPGQMRSVGLDIFEYLHRAPNKVVQGFAVGHGITSVSAVLERITISLWGAGSRRPAVHPTPRLTRHGWSRALGPLPSSRTATSGRLHGYDVPSMVAHSDAAGVALGFPTSWH